MPDSVFGPAQTDPSDNLVPYLQPRNFDPYTPSFMDFGHTVDGGGQNGSSTVKDGTNWGFDPGTADKNYSTGDLSGFFGNQGVAAPDWNQFYTPGTPAEYGQSGGEGGGSYLTKEAGQGSYDTAGATNAFNKYQSDIAGKLGLDPNGHYMFNTSMQNPTSTDSTHDYVNALYKQNADDTRYAPIWATPEHRTSNWVDNRGIYAGAAMGLATVASAGLASPAMAAGEVGTDAMGATVAQGALPAGYGASGATEGSIAAASGGVGTTIGQGLNLAKQGYGLYNTEQSLQNGDIMGAIGGGLSAYSGFGGEDPYGLARMARGGLGAYGAVNSALNGNYLGAVNGGLNAGSNMIGGADKFNGTLNKDTSMPDSYDPNASNTGLFGNPYENPSPLSTQGSYQLPEGVGNYGANPYSGGTMPDMPNGPQDQQKSNPYMDAIRGGLKTAQSVMNPNVGGMHINAGDVGAGLMGMYQGYQQKKQFGAMANQLSGMYGENSPYAQTLRHQLETKDAAAGRRSQYGPREVELQARLAEGASRNAPALAQMYQGKFGGGNQMLNSLQRVGTGMGGNGMFDNAVKYFNRPSGGLQGANPASDLGYRNGSDIASDGPGYADGGPVRSEPRVGSRGPVRTGGGGGLSPEAVTRALGPLPAASGPNTYVNPMNPNSANDYRERVQGLARGGSVYGPGTSRSDSIPARLSNGEHVMDAASVNAIGGGDNATGQARLNALRHKLRGGQ